MKEKVISVIIPAFNPGVFLEEAINSVENQTLSPLEIIVIDDGSNPEIKIPERRGGAEIRLLRQTNSGQATARNIGMNSARGDLIAFLDADDVWHSRKLEIQENLLRKFPDAGCVGCRAILISENGEFVGIGPGKFSRGASFLERGAFQTSSTKAILVPSMVLMKRSATLAMTGFNSVYQPIEDLVFFDKYFARGGKVLMSETPLLKRRLHGRSLTLKYRSMLKSYLAWANDIIKKDLGEQQAKRVKGAAFVVTGLSALACGNAGDARFLLKRAWDHGMKFEVFFPFLFSCLTPGVTSKFREIKRQATRKRAVALWNISNS